MTKQINLKVIKRNRQHTEGDVFMMQLPNDSHIFGRIVAYPADPSPWPESLLVYIYSHVSADANPSLEELTPQKLLIAPQFTNTLLWTKGYAVRVDHRPIKDTDLLEKYCFQRNDSYGNLQYVDENRKLIPNKIDPCGIWGMTSYQGLDDRISDALDIKRAPIAKEDLYYPNSNELRKFSDNELKKYANYDWLVSQYPEILEK